MDIEKTKRFRSSEPDCIKRKIIRVIFLGIKQSDDTNYTIYRKNQSNPGRIFSEFL